MHDQYSGQPSHVMMNDKAKSLLNESEYKTFTYYITQYKQHKLKVEDLVIALIEVLDTRAKVCNNYYTRVTFIFNTVQAHCRGS